MLDNSANSAGIQQAPAAVPLPASAAMLTPSQHALQQLAAAAAAAAAPAGAGAAAHGIAVEVDEVEEPCAQPINTHAAAAATAQGAGPNRMEHDGQVRC